MMTIEATASSGFGTVGLDVGVTGRWLRLAAGVATVAAAVAALATIPPAVVAPGQVVLAFAAVLTLYTVAVLLLGDHVLSRMNPWIGSALFLGPVLAVYAFHLDSPALRIGLSLYIGVSLIFSFFLRYGGCEVLAIPSLLLGKRYTVYCPYNAVDVVEKAVVDRRARR